MLVSNDNRSLGSEAYRWRQGLGLRAIGREAHFVREKGVGLRLCAIQGSCCLHGAALAAYMLTSMLFVVQLTLQPMTSGIYQGGDPCWIL